MRHGHDLCLDRFIVCQNIIPIQPTPHGVAGFTLPAKNFIPTAHQQAPPATSAAIGYRLSAIGYAQA